MTSRDETFIFYFIFLFSFVLFYFTNTFLPLMMFTPFCGALMR